MKRWDTFELHGTGCRAAPWAGGVDDSRSVRDYLYVPAPRSRWNCGGALRDRVILRLLGPPSTGSPASTRAGSSEASSYGKAQAPSASYGMHGVLGRYRLGTAPRRLFFDGHLPARLGVHGLLHESCRGGDARNFMPGLAAALMHTACAGDLSVPRAIRGSPPIRASSSSPPRRRGSLPDRDAPTCACSPIHRRRLQHARHGRDRTRPLISSIFRPEPHRRSVQRSLLSDSAIKAQKASTRWTFDLVPVLAGDVQANSALAPLPGRRTSSPARKISKAPASPSESSINQVLVRESGLSDEALNHNNVDVNIGAPTGGSRVRTALPSTATNHRSARAFDDRGNVAGPIDAYEDDNMDGVARPASVTLTRARSRWRPARWFARCASAGPASRAGRPALEGGGRSPSSLQGSFNASRPPRRLDQVSEIRAVGWRSRPKGRVFSRL